MEVGVYSADNYVHDAVIYAAESALLTQPSNKLLSIGGGYSSCYQRN